VVVWAQKFRVEEASHHEAMSSWFLDWLRRSRLLRAAGDRVRLWRERRAQRHAAPLGPARTAGTAPANLAPWSLVPLAALVAALAYGAWKLLGLVVQIPAAAWGGLLAAA